MDEDIKQKLVEGIVFGIIGLIIGLVILFAFNIIAI